jgi:hypothetical protein
MPTAGKHGKAFKSSDADERFPAATHAFTALGTDCSESRVETVTRSASGAPLRRTAKRTHSC